MKMRKISWLGWLGLLLIFCSAVFLVSVDRGAMSSLAAAGGAGRGVHLGNVPDGKEWEEAYFSLIGGQGGAWPDVIVVMSSRVWTVRFPAPAVSQAL